MSGSPGSEPPLRTVAQNRLNRLSTTLSALAGAAALCVALRAQESIPPAPVEAGAGKFRVELGLPSQDAFRSWPPGELVDRPYWLPWAWLFFQRAQMFDRPIVFFMTVPWNHLAQRMDREAFSDRKVLRAMNEGFLQIRVDADRRPDIRERYQTGNLPVVALMLPSGVPMLSHANPLGKALPITAGYLDTKNMLFFLQEGRTYYERWSDLLRGVGEYFVRTVGEAEPVSGNVTQDASDQMARWLLGNADRQNGGFGMAPKFVIPGLMEYARIREARMAPAVLEQAQLTLERLLASPLYDRRGGGVHRMAAAPNWGGIQYEKMLEGNAHLLRDLVFAARGESSTALRDGIQDTARFLTTVLSRPGGGFYLAQAADPTSLDGGGYWTAAEGETAAAPPVDRLVLAGENSLAGAALLRAGLLVEDPALVEAGRGAIELVLGAVRDRGRGIDHVIEPSPEPRRFLSTQADVALGLVDAYETTGETRYLGAAREIADFALNNLLVSGEKILRDHLPEPSSIGLLASPRHPMPDNVRLARVLLRLAAHGLGENYRERATSILGAFAGDLAAYGVHGVESALAIEEAVREPVVVRIEGPPDQAAARAMRRAALNAPGPWLVVQTAGDEGRGPSAAVVSWRGATARVDRPERLASEIRRLMAAASVGDEP